MPDFENPAKLRMEDKKFDLSEVVEYVRKAVDDRATWFYLLTEQARAAGVDPESIARRAVFQFGCMKGAKLEPTGDIREFIDGFASEVSKGVFAMELKEIDDTRAVLEFNYCPLVEAWKRLGGSPQDLDALCDWAMEGDRGVMENFPAIIMAIASRIGAGDKCCRLVFTKNAGSI